MTETALNTPPETAAEAAVIILFGRDERGKPRAATFGAAESELVAKAADLMALTVCPANSSALVEIAGKLPVGKIHATGRAMVPNVRRDLYDKLLDAACDADPQRSENTRPVPSGLPRTWDEISVGHLVLAHDTFESGWWEAVVVDRKGDILELAWRDLALPHVRKHAMTVALLNPNV